jgi:hypothetical protein
MADVPKQKVRTQWRLPVRTPPEEWLTLVLNQRPAINRLGAMTFYKGQLVIAGYLGRQVHLVPVEHASGSLAASLEPADREVLAGWLARIDAGEFAAEATRELKKYRAEAAW